jgi:hypothetical protein
MTPTSAGSLAKAGDSGIDVTMLIHSTCAGWSDLTTRRDGRAARSVVS